MSFGQMSPPPSQWYGIVYIYGNLKQIRDCQAHLVLYLSINKIFVNDFPVNTLSFFMGISLC